MDVEGGVCSGRVDQHHPLCVGGYDNHEPHLVDVVHRRKRLSAKDIPDEDFLNAVETAALMRGYSRATRWDVAAILSGNIDHVGYLRPRAYDNMPAKVVVAKARKMIRKGLIQGCACGCRGDYRLTELPKE